MTVIDVRSPLSQAATGRIPGALTVDATNMKVELLAIEPASEVIVYCACPNEASAVKVAKALMRARLQAGAPALRRHRRLDRGGVRRRALSADHASKRAC